LVDWGRLDGYQKISRETTRLFESCIATSNQHLWIVGPSSSVLQTVSLSSLTICDLPQYFKITETMDPISNVSQR
jgi:hypothetical protein